MAGTLAHAIGRCFDETPSIDGRSILGCLFGYGVFTNTEKPDLAYDICDPGNPKVACSEFSCSANWLGLYSVGIGRTRITTSTRVAKMSLSV
jgi:hypothetical protein